MLKLSKDLVSRNIKTTFEEHQTFIETKDISALILSLVNSTLNIETR